MKLLTKAIEKELPKLYDTDHLGGEKTLHVKFFAPWNNLTWYGAEFDGDDLFFGYVVGHESEFGYFTLSELESVRGPFGLKIERDMYFTPKTVNELVA